MTTIVKPISALFVISILLLATFSPIINPVRLAFAQDTPAYPATTESPLLLKQKAISQLSIVNGSGADSAIFEQAKNSLRDIVANDFWDDDHLKNPLSITSDRTIVQQLQTTNAYVNASDPDHDAVFACVVDIVQSERRLAEISVSDGSNVSKYLDDPSTLKLVNNTFNVSKIDDANGESYLQLQNMSGALQYYGASWAEANIGLLLADANESPIVNIISPLNGSYANAQDIDVSGNVEDVTAYSIRNVTLTVNGESLVVPLSEGSFNNRVRLQEGNNVIKVTAVDQCGNNATATSDIILDTVKPIVTISNVSNGKYYNGTVRPVVHISDANPNSSFILLDGVPYSEVETVDEGSHTLNVETTDNAGNMVKTDVEFVVDRTAPVAELYGLQVNGYLGKTILITGGMDDANPGNLSLRIDGVEVADQLPYRWNTAAYPDGNHTIELFVQDKALNSGYTNITVTVDNAPPMVRLMVPANGTISSSSLIRLLWSGSDNYGISFYQSLIDNTPTGDATLANNTTERLPEGNHQARIEAHDLANNTASDVVNFTVDTTVPCINISGVEEGKNYNYNVTPQINISDANLNSSVTMLNGIAYSGMPISKDGFYTLYAYADDLAGNSNYKIVNFTINKVQPLLSVRELTDNPTMSAPAYNLTGSVDANATLTIDDVTIPHGSTFFYSTNVTEGVNNFTVIATDANGNFAIWNKTRLVDSDRLPDYYEINVTHTDPLKGDTDGNGINDSSEDFDGDLLSNYAEYKLGTNPFKADTDDDGLNDLFEVLKSGTSPLKNNTYGDGINDSARDTDHDGLTNLQEQEYGTNPRYGDSDGDTLSDGDEVNVYHTNPILADTDKDGLTDDLEIAVGANPSNPDSDGNGILDGQDSFGQNFSNDTLGVNVQITESPYLQKTMKIQEDLYPYASLTRLPGVIGDFIDINSTSRFESATIRLYYNESLLNGSSESDLKLYYVNASSEMPVEAPDQRIDTDLNYIEAKTDHLGLWFICDNTRWAPMPNSTTKKAEFIGVATMGMQAEDVQSEDQSSDPLTFNIGDKINIRAQVHNEFSDDITDDVLVSFYAGDPDAGGVNIGNSTITGGIPFNTSKTAVLNDYTITSDSTDIYVKIDPLNQIPESDESNNEAYQVLSVGSQDSDGDGIPDIAEIGGMYDIRSHTLVYTDPYDNDTDGDGLSDGDEMGPQLHDDNGNAYYDVTSYPDYGRADSDGDGLSDLYEVTPHSIFIADTKDMALKFKNSIFSWEKSGALDEVQVTSDPLKRDTDTDGIDDWNESLMGTNPRLPDTDNDNIIDSQEKSLGDDPTVFDTKPPQAYVNNVNVYHPADSFIMDYYITYTVTDPSGVSSASILKDDSPRSTHTYDGSQRTVTQYDEVDTDWEWALDCLTGTGFDVNTTDKNGNSGKSPIWRKDSYYSQLASTLGYVSYDNVPVAGVLGFICGASSYLIQYPDLAREIINNPDTLKMMAVMTVVSQNPVFGDYFKLITSLQPNPMESAQNPYTFEDTPDLYTAFIYGWEVGYGISQAVVMLIIAAGTAVIGEITGSMFDSMLGSDAVETEILAEASITEDLTSAGAYSDMIVYMSRGVEEVGLSGDEITLVGAEPTAVKQEEALEFMKMLPGDKHEVMAAHQDFMDEVLMGTTPGDAANKISMYSSTLDNIWSLENLQGIQPDSMKSLRENLAEACVEDKLSTTQAEGIVANLRTLDGTPGLPTVIQNLYQANTASDFNGAAFQLERAAQLKAIPGNTVALEVVRKRIDIQVTNSRGITYIEDKSAMGPIHQYTIKGFLRDTIIKFRDTSDQTTYGNKKLEIDARKGLGNYDKNSVKDLINNKMIELINDRTDKKGPFPANIDEIEVLLPDGTSIVGIKNMETGLFAWG